MLLKFFIVLILDSIVILFCFAKEYLYSQNIYFGDFHTHSDLSFDAEGNIDVLYRYARDSSRLDFICFSEHDYNSSDSIWVLIKQKANFYNQPGLFTTFIGYEWTKPPSTDGHRIVIYRNNYPKRYKAFNTPLETLMTKVKNEGGLIIVAHPDHEQYYANKVIRDNTVQKYIDVNCWNRRSEYYGNPNATPNQKFGYSAQDWLLFSEPMGFTGSGDDHEGKPGTRGKTAVLADSLTRTSIFQSLQKRHVYALSGAKIKLLFSCFKGIIGDSMLFYQNETINFNVAALGTTIINRIDIIKNNSLIYSAHFNDSIINYTFPVQFWGNYNTLYIRVHQIDSNIAWSSPMYFYNGPITHIGESNNIQTDMVLQNYPNPFNNYTKINFVSKGDCCGYIYLYDVLGRKVCTIYEGNFRKGNNSILFESDIYDIASGVYFYKVKTGNEIMVKKMLIKK